MSNTLIDQITDTVTYIDDLEEHDLLVETLKQYKKLRELNRQLINQNSS